jgi:hypothetical protein
MLGDIWISLAGRFQPGSIPALPRPCTNYLSVGWSEALAKAPGANAVIRIDPKASVGEIVWPNAEHPS